MFKLPLDIKAGVPIYEQIVMATKRALATGILKSGDSFPSVREISRLHGVNPNTVQKAVTALIGENILEVHPGKGTVVKELVRPNVESLQQAVAEKLSAIIVELRMLGATKETLHGLVNRLWKLEE